MTKKLVANHIFHHADGVVFLCGAESLQTDIVTVQCSRNRCFMDIIRRLSAKSGYWAIGTVPGYNVQAFRGVK